MIKTTNREKETIENVYIVYCWNHISISECIIAFKLNSNNRENHIKNNQPQFQILLSPCLAVQISIHLSLSGMYESLFKSLSLITDPKGPPGTQHCPLLEHCQENQVWWQTSAAPVCRRGSRQHRAAHGWR